MGKKSRNLNSKNQLLPFNPNHTEQEESCMETKTMVVTKQDNKKAVHVQQEYDLGVWKSNKPYGHVWYASLDWTVLNNT